MRIKRIRIMRIRRMRIRSGVSIMKIHELGNLPISLPNLATS